MSEPNEPEQPEPMPPEPTGGADVRPEDGPQDPDLSYLNEQAAQVDELIEDGER